MVKMGLKMGLYEYVEARLDIKVVIIYDSAE
jgi:hypothetical protein